MITGRPPPAPLGASLESRMGSFSCRGLITPRPTTSAVFEAYPTGSAVPVHSIVFTSASTRRVPSPSGRAATTRLPTFGGAKTVAFCWRRYLIASRAATPPDAKATASINHGRVLRMWTRLLVSDGEGGLQHDRAVAKHPDPVREFQHDRHAFAAHLVIR